MSRVLPVLVLLSLAATPVGAQSVPPPIGAYELWKTSIRPSPEELSFARIRWRTSLTVAVEEARRRDRPVLLWAMNGHPLGFT